MSTEPTKGEPGSDRGWRASTGASIGSVIRSPNLRRVQLAWVGSDVGELMTFVIFGVYAFGEAGAAGVGVMGLVRTVPAALAVPFAAGLADRYPKERIMVGADLSRIVLIGLAALLISGDSAPAPVFVIAALVEVISATFRPAQQALMPSLAADETELTAANTMTSAVQSLAATLGPALGGLALALADVSGALLVCVAAYVWSVFNVLAIRVPESAAQAQGAPVAGAGREALAGFRAIVSTPGLRLIIGLFFVQTATWGAIQVLVTVLALDELGMGDGGPGILFAGSGAGGLLGALIVFAIVGRVHLGRCFGTGVLLWGAPLAVIAAWFDPVVAFVVLMITGAGNSLADVAGTTLLQHLAPAEAIARVFGVLESFVIAGIGAGAIAAPGLIDLFGLHGAFLAVALAVSLVVGASWRRLSALGEGDLEPSTAIETVTV